MIKRGVGAGLLIWLLWSLLDTVLHGWLLRPVYDDTASLWRPAEQVSTPLVLAATLLLISVFLVLYVRLVRPKSLMAGLRVGLLFGVALGTASGLGSYIHMPIPQTLAWAWFLAGVAKGGVAGLVVGLLIRREGERT